MYIWWIGIFISDFIKYLFGLELFFRMKSSKHRIIVAGVGIVLYLLLLLCGIVDEKTPILFSTATTLILICFSLVLGWKQKIIVVAECAFVMICIDEVISRLGHIMFFHSVNVNDVQNKPYYFICNSVVIILLVLVYWIKGQGNTRINKLVCFFRRFIYLGIGIIVFSLLLTIGGLSYAADYVDNPMFYKITDLLSLVSLFGIIILGGLMIHINGLNKKVEQSLDVERFLKLTQEEYYKAMLAKEENTRHFRHDIQNHLLCISELARKEDLEAINRYICNLREKMDGINKNCYSVGNEIVDIILNYYLNQLSDTKITVSGYCSSELDLNDIAICTIFSNIIQNTVEELNRQKNDKWFHIKVITGRTNVTVVVSNSSSNKLSMDEKGGFITKKEDKRNHGLGLKNVREVIDENGGLFRYHADNNQFTVEVMIPIKRI